jgi:Domain of unknown function (DUF1906)/D-alanyl-D-alanine carboxypeptidase
VGREGVDYSYSAPTVAELKAAVKTFAIRYLCDPPTAKNLTRAEAERLSAGGIDLVCVYQSGRSFMLGGAAAGRRDAEAAAGQATRCGMPDGRPIYFALDIDPRALTGGQWAAIDGYLTAATAILGRQWVGIYGGKLAIDRQLANGTARWGWQTISWSGGQWSPRACLQQYRHNLPLGSGIVDLDRATVDDFGQWKVDLPMPNAQERGWGPPCPSAQIVTIDAGGRRFSVHRKVAVIFKTFITELVTRGYPINRGTLDDWSYNCRHIANDPSRPWSNHAWGLAVDINSLTNPMRSPLTTDMPAWVRDEGDLLRRYGLRWGGEYRVTPDPMHFEFMLTPDDATRITANLTTGPSEGDWLDMATKEDVKDAVREVLTLSKDGEMAIIQTGQVNNNKAWQVLVDRLTRIEKQVIELKQVVDGLVLGKTDLGP